MPRLVTHKGQELMEGSYERNS